MSHFSTKTVLAALLLSLVAFAGLWYQRWDNQDRPALHTVSVKRGDLVATISATGTVEPEEVVDVGAQVAGKIVAFGRDKDGKTLDYGSVVEEGTVLAQIDDALYVADAAQAQSQLQQAKAGLQRAEADLGQLKAKLFQAERDWHRTQKLGPSRVLAQKDYDAAFSAYEIAKANLAVGRAAIIQAKEAVSQAEATLQRAKQNLAYCTIRSPVKGVIIDRRVNIGQTVVASLSAPSLFLIAKDLTRLQVWVSVNEADIGQVRPGQPVTFTVDAFPDQVFRGEVKKVRLNASMTQNVVTYTVEVSTDNRDGKLLPYLTANVKFLVDERHHVLLVPNSALRWMPRPDQVIPGSRGASGTGPSSMRLSDLGVAAAAGQNGLVRGMVWVPQGEWVKPVSVRIGLSDGALTEVESEELQEGTPVVIGELQKEGASPTNTSPFTPQLFRGHSAR